MSEIKILGHINPDTDSTCTPIVYAWYLTNIKSTPAKAFIANEPNKEALYLLNRFGFEKPEIITTITSEDKIIIIDTNNADELIDGFDSAEIIEIIDHHKLFGNISTSSPIKITIEPVACVATIIWQKILKDGSAIPANAAGMLLGSILSDTLKFTSPTTTQEDIDAANQLATLANVEITELADKMFEAKSDLSGMDADAILHMDSKIFDFSNKKIRISVLETTKPINSLNMISEIKNRMTELKHEEGLDMILFFIVDIINSSSEVIVTTQEEKQLIAKSFSTKFNNETVTLSGVVSRKKQIVPKIEEALK